MVCSVDEHTALQATCECVTKAKPAAKFRHHSHAGPAMMHKILLVPIVLGVATALSFVGFAINDAYEWTDTRSGDGNSGTSGTNTTDVLPQPADDVFGESFTYYDVELLSAKLSESDLYLSTPAPITDHTISQYCSYYDRVSETVKSVSYCTTSGIDDQNGITIGNFNLGGDTTHPVMALAVLDPIGTLDDSKRGTSGAVAVFEGMVATLVCDGCWAEQNPGGFGSVYEWMQAVESMLKGAEDRDTLRSTISGFTGGDNNRVEMMLEATATTDGGYQWTFTILQ